jgi:hypothetical protein
VIGRFLTDRHLLVVMETVNQRRFEVVNRYPKETLAGMAKNSLNPRDFAASQHPRKNDPIERAAEKFSRLVDRNGYCDR